MKTGLMLVAAAVVAAGAVPAFAADPRPVVAPVRVVAPAAPGPWADVTLFGGWEQTLDTFETCEDFAGSVIGGEARLGWPRIGGGGLQIDIHGTSDDMKPIGCNTGEPDQAAVFGASVHWTFMGGPGSGLAIMGSVGNWQETPRVWTLAAEGYWSLSPATRIVVQAGSSFLNNEGSLFTTPYIHGVVQQMLGPALMVSGNIGFAAPDSGDGRESVLRFGAKLELAISQTMSGFVEWQGIRRVEADDPANITNNNRLMVGATFRLNNIGGLMASSPLHDFNWWTGLNNQFEF